MCHCYAATAWRSMCLSVKIGNIFSARYYEIYKNWNPVSRRQKYPKYFVLLLSSSAVQVDRRSSLVSEALQPAFKRPPFTSLLLPPLTAFADVAVVFLWKIAQLCEGSKEFFNSSLESIYQVLVNCRVKDQQQQKTTITTTTSKFIIKQRCCSSKVFCLCYGLVFKKNYFIATSSKSIFHRSLVRLSANWFPPVIYLISVCNAFLLLFLSLEKC